MSLHVPYSNRTWNQSLRKLDTRKLVSSTYLATYQIPTALKQLIQLYECPSLNKSTVVNTTTMPYQHFSADTAIDLRTRLTFNNVTIQLRIIHNTLVLIMKNDPNYIGFDKLNFDATLYHFECVINIEDDSNVSDIMKFKTQLFTSVFMEGQISNKNRSKWAHNKWKFEKVLTNLNELITESSKHKHGNIAINVIVMIREATPKDIFWHLLTSYFGIHDEDAAKVVKAYPDEQQNINKLV